MSALLDFTFDLAVHLLDGAAAAVGDPGGEC